MQLANSSSSTSRILSSIEMLLRWKKVVAIQEWVTDRLQERVSNNRRVLQQGVAQCQFTSLPRKHLLSSLNAQIRKAESVEHHFTSVNPRPISMRKDRLKEEIFLHSSMHNETESWLRWACIIAFHDREMSQFYVEGNRIDWNATISAQDDLSPGEIYTALLCQCIFTRLPTTSGNQLQNDFPLALPPFPNEKIHVPCGWKWNMIRRQVAADLSHFAVWRRIL